MKTLNSLVPCPFKAPVTRRLSLSGQEIECETFEPKEGLSLSRTRFEGDGKTVAWPFDSFMQICFLAKGRLAIGAPEIGERSIRPGDWFLLSALDWQARCRFEDPVELLWIDCSQELWTALTPAHEFASHTQKACFGCAQRMEALFVAGHADSNVFRLAQELLTADASAAAKRLAIEAKTLELLSLVLDNLSLAHSPRAEPCLRDADEEAIEAAAAYLEANLAADHSLGAISRAAHLNEFKLKKGFRERYDTTVFGFLRRKRMERASELLREDDRTIIDVANEVGYANPSHFTRAFRERFGMNPKSFAKGLGTRSGTAR